MAVYIYAVARANSYKLAENSAENASPKRAPFMELLRKYPPGYDLKQDVKAVDSLHI